MWLFGLVLALPIVEIALFIQVGGLIGLWPTLLLVILSAMLGSWVIRSQGRRAMADLQKAMQDLSDPARPMAHGALIVLAGILLIIPGFATDLVGLALLVPAVRDLVLRRLAARMPVTRVSVGFPPRRDDVIDGDFVVETDPDDQPPAGSSGRQALPGHNRPSGWTRE